MKAYSYCNATGYSFNRYTYVCVPKITIIRKNAYLARLFRLRTVKKYGVIILLTLTSTTTNIRRTNCKSTIFHTITSIIFTTSRQMIFYILTLIKFVPAKMIRHSFANLHKATSTLSMNSVQVSHT